MHLIKLSNYQLSVIKDDPVRGHIPAEWRIQNGREVYGLFETQYAEQTPVDHEGPLAVICVAYTRGVADSEEYMSEHWQDPDTAMFYTVWSYAQGAGREIVFRVAKHIQNEYPHITRFCTLSPLTEMAERFHTRNGAQLIHRNSGYQNFEYTL